MSDSWKQWEGQVVDEKFPLHRFLGGSDHSAVFLTDRGTQPQKTAIKFIQIDEPDAELQLFRWRHAGKLSHPHLLRTFEAGRCRLGGFNLLYLLMELAEENLSQFLPQRPLTPAEARDVLTPTLQALAYLHSEGLVHGRLRPSNILAIDDQLKLSIDAISPITEHAEQSHLSAADPQQSAPANSLHHPSPYDPPEIAKGIVSPAGDVWSLGITIVEALTQHLPAFTGATQTPVVPDTLPALFLDIARYSLHRDSARRWTIAEISARLNPGSVAPYASASAAPSAVRTPVVTPPAIIPALAPPQATPASAAMAAPKQEHARPTRSPAVTPPVHTQPVHTHPVHTQSVAIRGTSSRPRYDLVQPHLQRPPLLPPLPKLNYFKIGGVAAFILIAIFVGPRLFRHRTPVQQAAAIEPQQPAAVKPIAPPAHSKNSSKSAQKPAPPKTSAPQSSQHLAQTAPQTSLQKTNDNRAFNDSHPAPAPVALSVSNPSHVDAPAKPASGSVSQGEVLDQIMPNISAGARATIRGTVRVAVKLHVDSTGNVKSAELFSPGPSKYFADQTLQAAHRWDFAPAKVDGHAVPSDWLVRFEFTPTASKAHPTQSTP
jgi:TonB family protein